MGIEKLTGQNKQVITVPAVSPLENADIVYPSTIPFVIAHLSLVGMFWTGISLGALGLLMLHHITGGAWSFTIRRVLEAGVSALPLTAALFIPVLVGLGHLYLWADPVVMAEDKLLQHKAFYLNAPFFIGRSVFYFLVWIVLGTLLRRWSFQQDVKGDNGLGRKMHVLSAPG